MSTEENATSLMFSSPSKKDLENVTNTRKEEHSTTNTMPSGETIRGGELWEDEICGSRYIQHGLIGEQRVTRKYG